MIRLSDRLEQASGYLKGFTSLLDIGTDHAKLPIEAVFRGYVKRAIAVDNKMGPLKNAQKNIEAAGLSGQIRTILADGIPAVEDYDVLSILGLGGIAIKDILESAGHIPAKRLVLAPHSEAAILRGWLKDNRYRITDEKFLIDRGKAYQIIVAEEGEMELDETELEFGPVIIKKREPAFTNHIAKLILIYEKALSGATDRKTLAALQKRIAILKGLIS